MEQIIFDLNNFSIIVDFFQDITFFNKYFIKNDDKELMKK